MDRFDSYLSKSLDEVYLKLLQDNVVQEIVICDENGNDFEKLNEKYSKLIDNGIKLRLYKNSKVLGAFLNKMKACKLAFYDCVALIDSDNVVDETYFQVAREYIDKTQLPTNYILSPSNGKTNSNVDFTSYSNKIIDRNNVSDCIVTAVDRDAPGNIWHIDLVWNSSFISLLNLGNYILSKSLVYNVTYEDEMLPKIISCDVTYFNSLAFKQVNDFQFHVVENLELEYLIHEEGLQIVYSKECNGTLWDYLVPYFRNEMGGGSAP